MSYVEHGSRIFLTGLPNVRIPLANGDYSIPRKRSEGRLKLHDSCSDIRAWSPNFLENSRYFRELAEHVTPTGNIIPINVVIDSIIDLTEKAQNELHLTKKELQQYKALKLTPEQQEQLKIEFGTNRENNQFPQDKNSSDSKKILLEKAFSDIRKPMCQLSELQQYSQLSIRLPNDEIYDNNTKDNENEVNSMDKCNSSKNGTDSLYSEDYSSKPVSYREVVNVALQVVKDVRDIGLQFDGIFGDHPIIKISFQSVQSTTSSISEFNSGLSATEQKSKSLTSESDLSVAYDPSDSLESQTAENQTESDNEESEDLHKRIIIQKDSEIIVLKNDLCVKEAEIEELHECNKDLADLLKNNEDRLTMLYTKLKVEQDELTEIKHKHGKEVEDLKEQLCTYVAMLEQLKDSLNRKDEAYCLQAQEIDQLRKEKDAFSMKVEEIENELYEEKKNRRALKELQNVMQEKEKLEKQVQEQSCILGDQEDEIKRLMILINQISAEYDDKKKAAETVEVLKTAVNDKDIKLSQYEVQLVSMRQQISDFFNNLKKSLNNFDEINEMFDDPRTYANIDSDVGDEANGVLYSLNIIMTRFQNYRMKYEELLQEMQELKYNVGIYKQQSLPDMESCKYLLPSRNQSNSSQLDNYEIQNFVSSQYSISNIQRQFVNTEEINTPQTTDNIEKEIIEQVSCSLDEMHSLMHQLQIYIEVEKPMLVKEFQNCQKIIAEIESTLIHSQDTSTKCDEVCKLYKNIKDNCRESICHLKDFPKDLSEIVIQLYESIEAILHRCINETASLQKRDLNDKRIDEALAKYFKFYSQEVNIILKDFKAQHSLEMDKMLKQSRTIQENNIEIANLKKQISQYQKQKEERERMYKEELAKADTIKNELSIMTTEVREKNLIVSKLEAENKLTQNKLSSIYKDYVTLKNQSKSLENEKDKLQRECEEYKDNLQLKIQEVNNQSRHIRNLLKTRHDVTLLKDQMSKMENRLLSLQFENDTLRSKMAKANESMADKDKKIMKLEKYVENSVDSYKVVEYETTIKDKQNQIVVLEEEQKCLSDKLHNAETMISQMNENILLLTKENTNIDFIHDLQETLIKVDKREAKLQVRLKSLKAAYSNYQNISKKLESKLKTFVQQNHVLKEDVEYWKNEIDQLSKKSQQGSIEIDSKQTLQKLPNELFQKISNIKLRLYKNVATKQNNLLNNKNDAPENKLQITELKSKNKSHEDINDVRSERPRLENETQLQRNEEKNLSQDVKTRDAEIRTLKQLINSLVQEKIDLQDMLKLHAKNCPTKSSLMPMNYDSRVQTLGSERKNSLDPENWLHFLNIAQLRELHNKICISKSCMDKVRTDVKAKTEIDRKDIISTDHYQPEESTTAFLTMSQCEWCSVIEKESPFFNEKFYKKYNTHTSLTVQRSTTSQTTTNNNNRVNDTKLCEKENYIKETNQTEIFGNTQKPNTLDKQRCNFIFQCSMHHNFGNT